MGIRILKPGLMTTVQDSGRHGYQSQGFSVSGVMDVRSFRIANLLLDNPENEAVLEFSLVGPTIVFTEDTIIAITGGDFQPTVNGEPAAMYTALYIHAGDILAFSGARTGSRGYISFSGGLKIPEVMGSRSTNVKVGLGGFKGRQLQADDYIPFRSNRLYLPHFLSRKLPADDFDQEEAVLRVILGPQDHYFTEEGLQTFLRETYTVTKDFDRMGCRLYGPSVVHKDRADIISDATVFGAIQVPAHGKPIVLLADRQTTGGYAKIGAVISVDLPKLVQRKMNHRIRFEAVSVEEAQNLLQKEAAEFEHMRSRIHQPCPEILTRRRTAKRLASLFERNCI